MNTTAAILAAIALSSCASETITTVKRPDGKETITVTKKQPPSDGIVTMLFKGFMDAVLHTFISEEK